MLDSCQLTESPEIFAGELCAIVGTDDEGMLLQVDLPLEKRLLQSLYDIGCFARFPSIIRHNVAVKDVDNAGHVEVPTGSRDVTILDVHLPQLIGARHDPITCDLLWNRMLDLALRSQDLQFLAQPVDLFLVDH
mgnify:CR=1 FL=1